MLFYARFSDFSAAKLSSVANIYANGQKLLFGKQKRRMVPDKVIIPYCTISK
jgi:hypothetical protein